MRHRAELPSWRGGNSRLISANCWCSCYNAIRSRGNSDETQDHRHWQFGRALPKELLERLRVDKGDALHAIELPDGIKLTPSDPKLAEQMRSGEKVMRERRVLLRKVDEVRVSGDRSQWCRR